MTRRFVAGASRRSVLIALLAIGAGKPAPPDAFAGIPGLRFVYRPVTGASVAELQAALEASARHPPGGGSSYAHTESQIDWHWRSRKGAHAACRVGSADVSVRATVTLPRLVDPAALDDATLARWERFRIAIEAHEAGHVRLARRYVQRIKAALINAPCIRADALARAEAAALDRAQADYDRVTRHGAAQGARFP